MSRSRDQSSVLDAYEESVDNRFRQAAVALLRYADALQRNGRSVYDALALSGIRPADPQTPGKFADAALGEINNSVALSDFPAAITLVESRKYIPW